MCILLLSLVASIHKDIWISMQRNSTLLYLILWHFKLMRDSSSLPNWFCLLISASLSATGQETMLQLLQWRSLIKQAVFRPLINLNARSRRYIDWLNAAPEFEKSFRFGQLWHIICMCVLPFSRDKFCWHNEFSCRCRLFCSSTLVWLDDCHGICVSCYIISE